MSSTTPALRFIGVPEAFNDPWSQTDFSSLPIPPTFTPCPGGSGAMLKALTSNTADAAFILTDCAIASIENKQPIRIVSPFITTPLIWGVVTSPTSTKTCINDLHNATWGVSRLGSGSHVMARSLAKRNGWKEPQFVTCGNFEALREAVKEGTVDAFLWEKFTTRPYERKGQVRLIGEVPTLWGCFCVAVREDCDRVAEVRKVVEMVAKQGEVFKQMKGESVKGIQERYGMTEEDGNQWLNGVEYVKPGETIPKEELNIIRETLIDAGVIQHTSTSQPTTTTSYFVS